MKFLKCTHMGMCICVHVHTHRSSDPPTKDPFRAKVFQGLNIRYTKLFSPYFNDLSQLDVFLIYNTIFATTKKCGISDDQNDFRSQCRTLFSAISPYQCQVQNLN